jgi:hypothetical protein
MVIFFAAVLGINAAYAQGVKLIEIPVAMPDLNQLFLNREAKISIQEYPLAEQLKLLLKTSEYLSALKLLSEYEDKKSPALLLVEGNNGNKQS